MLTRFDSTPSVHHPQVSKEFTSLVYDGTLWPSIAPHKFPYLDFSTRSPSFSPTHLLTLASHARSFVRSLSLRDSDFFSSSTLRKVGLDLSQPGGGSTNLAVLDVRCNRSISALVLGQLLASSPNIRSVDLSFLPGHVVKDVLPLLEENGQLRTVRLDHCGLTSDDVEGLLRTNEALERVSLKGLAWPEGGSRIAVPSLIGQLANVRTVDLEQSILPLTFFWHVVVQDPLSRQEQQDGGRQVLVSSGRSYEWFPPSTAYSRRTLGKLEFLNLSGTRLEEDQLGILDGSVLPRLRFLLLTDLRRSTEPGLASFLAGVGRTLEKVDLDGSDTVTDEVLEVLGGMEKLEEVCVSSCVRVEGRGFGALVRGRRLKVLEADVRPPPSLISSPLSTKVRLTENVWAGWGVWGEDRGRRSRTDTSRSLSRTSSDDWSKGRGLACSTRASSFCLSV